MAIIESKAVPGVEAVSYEIFIMFWWFLFGLVVLVEFCRVISGIFTSE